MGFTRRPFLIPSAMSRDPDNLSPTDTTSGSGEDQKRTRRPTENVRGVPGATNRASDASPV